jgi:hypothetical protein
MVKGHYLGGPTSPAKGSMIPLGVVAWPFWQTAIKIDLFHWVSAEITYSEKSRLLLVVFFLGVIVQLQLIQSSSPSAECMEIWLNDNDVYTLFDTAGYA